MSKVDDFRKALELIKGPYAGTFRNSSDFSIARNMKHWLCVHATAYTPRRNKDGQLYIPTTGMATGYKYARATVHFTLNQIVSSHAYGNWDNSSVIILAPYNDVVDKNGTPREVASEDTFFIPNPDKGLILPESAHIVKPGNGTLFNIGEKVSTYKTDKFTKQEIETILSLVDPYKREEYEKYDNADFTENEIQNLLKNEKVRKSYEKSTDKRAFLRGLFDETRIIILTKFLREAVVRMTMNKMGYEYVVARENAFSRAVADTARANGISADSGNKGHSGTQEREFEQIGLMYLDLVRVCETNNIEEIYEYCLNHDELTNVILTDTMLNVYQAYKESFDEFIKEIRFRVKFAQDLATMYPDKPYNEDEWQKTLADADRWELGGIKEYNPYLDIVLHRNASRLARDCAKAIEKLQRNKEYPLLKKMLMDLVKNGKRWYKTPFGWEPESSLDMLEPEFDMIDMHERVSY